MQILLRFTGKTNKDDIFEDTLNKAIEINMFGVPDKGSDFSKNDSLMDKMFKYYNDTNDANNDRFDLEKTIINEINSDRPVVFSVPGHSTVAVAYHTYKVNYQERYWSWFKYKYRYTSFTTVVFEVNNGWHSSYTGVKYYPANKIANIIDYGLTKVK